MIGDFDYIEAYTSGEFNGERVLCRVYTPVGLADQGHYSLDLAVKVNTSCPSIINHENQM
jgi:aminopeptidase 2